MTDYSHTWKPVEPSLKHIQNPRFGEPPPKPNEYLKMLGQPAIESFDFMLKEGLHRVAADIQPLEFELKSGQRIKVKFNKILIEKPSVADDPSSPMYPKECRIRKQTYSGRLTVQLSWWIDGDLQLPIERSMGHVPIMVKSSKCNLSGLSPKQLVKKGEHDQEWGGYFIIKGYEKILRFISATRKNYPITVDRDIWKRRGKQFTSKGVYIRCVRDDFTTTNNVLHYLANGTVKFMCSYQRSLFILPLVMVLKALMNAPDSYLYDQLTVGLEDDLYYKDRIASMLQLVQKEGLHSQEQVRNYIGRNFRPQMGELPEWWTDEEVCAYLFRRAVCIHLDSDEEKFHLVVFMTRKLFAYAQGKCAEEGTDPVMVQEVSLPGHTYLQLIKDRLNNWFKILKSLVLKKQRQVTTGGRAFQMTQGVMSGCLQISPRIDQHFTSFLSTGTVPTKADLGLMQSSGLSIMAENINRMRYMSHFRSVHRGASFMDSRSSEVRQLKSDAWGFLCPVHTPDGGPCGLLNHMSSTCQVANTLEDTSGLADLLVELGMTPLNETKLMGSEQVGKSFVVMLEGGIVGRVEDKNAARFVDKLRLLKVFGRRGIPKTLEIAFVPRFDLGQYPGIFLFSGPGRMMRPVLNLAAGAVELIGTLEQVYLNICVTAAEAYEGVTTHQELAETGFLSNVAALIPLPDFNQSPRNMYQCQMGKQTMGSPLHTWAIQTETKLFRLQTPASPLLRTQHWDRIQMDDFAMGTNAIVAVVSYTGYDMEDAMVINRGSLQRGFAHGQVYKTEFIDLKDISRLNQNVMFHRDMANEDLNQFLDVDGLPFPGVVLNKDDPMYCYLNETTGVYKTVSYKDKETIQIDGVKLCGTVTDKRDRTKVCITYRIQRNPQIGDKFASRAGQKGICSQQWLSEDLPFTESGLVPDIVFNPHGFPSRMTIAMMIELMAGKSASVHGMVHDATAFRFSEDETAIDYHGRLLEEAGYNYYGTEKLYSGVDGREMEADIFFGVVHYQRLRHMVSDKFQVRSTGNMDALTHQPVQGRKRGGGVRFGEMERDGLLSHGALYFLFDRLFNCSDQSTIEVCRKCGVFLPPLIELPVPGMRSGVQGSYSNHINIVRKCNVCTDGGKVEVIMAPFVYKYLLAELGAVNIQMCMDPGHI